MSRDQMTRVWGFLCGVSLCGLVHAGSGLGLEALGEERGALSAAQLGRGFSGSAGAQDGPDYSNPARLAYDRNTVFSATLSYEGFYADGPSGLGRDQFQLGALTMGFPLGGFGALGLGVWPRYTVNFYARTILGAEDTSAVRYRGSLMEIVPAYAWRFPGAMRALALGVQYRIPIGHVERSILRAADVESADSAQAYWLRHLHVEDRVVADWERAGGEPGYWGGSAHWRNRRWDLYVGYSQAYALRQRLVMSQNTGLMDTSAHTIRYRRWEMPEVWSAGMNLRLLKILSLTADFRTENRQTDWMPATGGLGMPDSVPVEDRSLFWALGLQKEGSGWFYDPFWKRNTFRVGGWWKQWYLHGVSEQAAALGMGLPLGKRGAKLDLGLAVGYRTVEFADNEWFWHVAASFTGVGEWGKSSRRR